MPRAGQWVLAATVLGSAMAFLDGTVVNVALPVLQTSLNASVAGAQWVVESYALFSASLILVGGSLGDRYGRDRVFAVGVLGFGAASAWCGLAPTIGQLIVARGVQGIAAALLIPGSLSLISSNFPKDERGKAIGTWSSLTALSLLGGPLLGGWLAQHVSWRAVFFINVPIAVVVLAIVMLRVPRSHVEPQGRIDLAGAILATVGLGGVVYGLIEAPAGGWSDVRVVSALAIGVACLVAFVIVEARADEPLVPLELFRSRAFTGTNLLTLLLYGALGAAMFFLPFNLIQVQHYSPSQAGASFMPFVVTMTLLSRWSGALVHKVGARLPLIVGPLTVACGFLLLMRPSIGGSYWTTFFPGILFMSIGMGITVAPLTTTVMAAVEEAHAGTASGINNAVSRTAGLLAIAVVGVVAIWLFTRSAERIAPPHLRPAILAQRTRLASAHVPGAERVIALSFVAAFRGIMLGCALLAALSTSGAMMMKTISVPRSSPDKT